MSVVPLYNIYLCRLDANASLTPSTLPTAPPGSNFQLDNLEWSRIAEIQEARRFPDQLGLDPTCKTNGRQLPLTFQVGQNSDGKTTLWGTALFGEGELSSNFMWLLEDGIGWIYGDEIMDAISITSSDGDFKIYTPAKSLIKRGKLGGQTARDLWHAVTKPYAKVLAGADLDEKKLHLPIQRATNSWRKYAESKAEIAEVFNACREYVAENQSLGLGSDSRWAATLTFLDEVEALTPELAFAYFPRCIYGNFGTYRNEGENAGLKENPNVHSKAKLVQVYEANFTRLENRSQQRNIIAERFEITVPAGHKDLGDRKHILQMLGTRVGKRAEVEILRKLQESRKLSVRQVSSSEYEVRHPIISSFDKDGTRRLWVSPPRRRLVHIVGERLVCDCPYSSRENLPCGDVLAVTGGNFGLDAVHVRYTLPYRLGRMDGYFFPRAGERPKHPALSVYEGIRFDRQTLPVHAWIEDSDVDGLPVADLGEMEPAPAELPLEVRYCWLCKVHTYTHTHTHTHTRVHKTYTTIHSSIRTPPQYTLVSAHKHTVWSLLEYLPCPLRHQVSQLLRSFLQRLAVDSCSSRKLRKSYVLPF